MPPIALFEEEIIDIVVGDELFIGFNEVLVFVNGEPTTGKIVFERGKTSFDRELSDDGSIMFYFDEPGEWVISFGNATKEVQVKDRENYLPSSKIEKEFKEQASVGPATGLISAANVDWRWLLLLVLILGIAWAAYEKLWRVVKIKKKLVNGQIQVTIKNRREKVMGLELIETVREEPLGEYSEEPSEVKETINGWVLKWRKSELEPGQEWTIKYASRTEKITPSELRFKEDNGKEHCVFS